MDDKRLASEITLKLLCEALWRRGEVFNPLAITAFTVRGRHKEIAVSTARGFRKLRFDQSRFRSVTEPRTRTLWG